MTCTLLFLFAGTRTWKPELEGATDRSSPKSYRRVQNEYTSHEKTKSPAPAIGDRSQYDTSSSSEGKHWKNSGTYEMTMNFNLV